MTKYYALKFKNKFVVNIYNEKYENYWLDLDELNEWNISDTLYYNEEEVEWLINDMKKWITAKYNHQYVCSFEKELLDDRFESLKIVEIDLDFNYKEKEIN